MNPSTPAPTPKQKGVPCIIRIKGDIRLRQPGEVLGDIIIWKNTEFKVSLHQNTPFNPDAVRVKFRNKWVILRRGHYEVITRHPVGAEKEFESATKENLEHRPVAARPDTRPDPVRKFRARQQAAETFRKR